MIAPRCETKPTVSGAGSHRLRSGFKPVGVMLAKHGQFGQGEASCGDLTVAPRCETKPSPVRNEASQDESGKCPLPTRSFRSALGAARIRMCESAFCETKPSFPVVMSTTARHFTHGSSAQRMAFVPLRWAPRRSASRSRPACLAWLWSARAQASRLDSAGRIRLSTAVGSEAVPAESAS